MNIIFVLISISLIILTAPFAEASTKLDCKKPTSNIEMKGCAKLEYDRADKELNKVYKRAIKAMEEFDKKFEKFSFKPPKAKQKLIESEKAWILLRDLDCEVRAVKTWGGTNYSLVYIICKKKKTLERTEFLKGLIKRMEGR